MPAKPVVESPGNITAKRTHKGKVTKGRPGGSSDRLNMFAEAAGDGQGSKSIETLYC